MKKLGLLLVGLGIVGGVVWGRLDSHKESMHYHAGFVVYVDGVKQDYSGYQYMNYTPCSEHNKKKSAREEQIEKAHLHDGVGDVVHVHRSGARWEDLFENIGVRFDEEPEILRQKIEPNSSVVITIGKEVENPAFVTLEHIMEVEAKSELCES